MTKKLFVFDLDGTLLNSAKEVSPSTMEILKQIRQAGHEIAIATGRTYSMSKEFIETSQINHFIVCNGSAAYLNHEQFYINPLNRTELTRLLEIACSKTHHFIYETPDQLKRHYNDISPRVIDGMNSVKQPLPSVDSEFYLNEELVQLLLFVNSEELNDYYLNRFEKLQFVRWHNQAVDVIPASGSKWETIKLLAKKLNLKIEDVITFGDGNNDLEMLRDSKISVAMGNASNKLKEVATFVAESNDSDGISKIIKEKNLI